MTEDLDDAALWLAERLADLRNEWPEVQEDFLMHLAEADYKLVIVRRQVIELGDTPRA